MTDTILNFKYGDFDHKVQEALPYTTCGLDGIFLSNGYRIDVVDGEEFIHVTDVEGLHIAIGKYVATCRKALSPDEVRFLRKTMDWTQEDLAKKLAKNVQSIARWEKGEFAIPGPAEKLLRVLFLANTMTLDEITEFKEFLANKMSELDEADETCVPKAQFELLESWEEKANAA